MRLGDLPTGGTVVCALGVILLMLSHGLAPGGGKESGPSIPFALARVHLEHNATDGDAEVVFEVKGGKEGLARLSVLSPDGRTVIDFTAPDASTLGIRQFRFETPEPGDVESLKSAYPEGVYTFIGATAAGGKLRGESPLKHKLPATASVLRPEAGARGVGVKNLKIGWTPVKNLAAYVIAIEQPALGAHLTATVSGSVATFAVPDGFLVPDTQYQLAIGTVSDDGNTSFVETGFTTAGKD